MSFSLDIKNELAEGMPNARHCRIAELSALVSMCAGADDTENRELCIVSENEVVRDRIITLIKKLFSCEGNEWIQTEKNRLGKQEYLIYVPEAEAGKLVQTLKLKRTEDGFFSVNPMVYSQFCCKRAFIRGAFLASGSVSDPSKDYHFEIVTDGMKQAETLIEILEDFEIDAKIIDRKRYHVVYVKDSEHIVDILNIIEAHVALMNLENVRILKDMRNSVNRRVNCEAANIGKTIAAAGKQIEDIEFISRTIGFEKLSQELAMTADLRLQYPEASLKELGEMHDKPLGRSGVNHRLQRLSEMAEKLRNGQPVDNLCN